MSTDKMRFKTMLII